MDLDPIATLHRASSDLAALGVRFALVGGLGVSVRAEVRFTRDVDLAVDIRDDEGVEALVRELRNRSYAVVAVVEHDDAKRLATVRLRSPTGITVDLLSASSGIEPEIVARASPVVFEGSGSVPVAQPEELLAMKVLSLDDRRLQDRIDARALIEVNVNMDWERVRQDLRLVEQRGFHRRQNLQAKLDEVLRSAEPWRRT
jgi:hypothetical protein